MSRSYTPLPLSAYMASNGATLLFPQGYFLRAGFAVFVRLKETLNTGGCNPE
jgi:hypothetical protein